MNVWRGALATVLAMGIACPAGAFAQGSKPILQVDPIPRRPSAEFYTTRPGAGTLIGVNLWGELAQPGRHYLQLGSRLSDAIGASGGPSGQADVGSIRLVRGSDYKTVDLFKDGVMVELQDGDSVYVPRSVKYDLPIYFGAASVIVSLLTLYYVRSKN